jgi:hypothetical protein
MSFVKLAMACGLAAAVFSGCGITAKPLAGTPRLDSASGYYGRVLDPRADHAACLRAAGLSITEYYTRGGQRNGIGNGLPAIQVGTTPTGPTIVFEPNAGMAEGTQISGQVTGAEEIGAALLFPNRASDALLKTVEGCTDIGVTEVPATGTPSA